MGLDRSTGVRRRKMIAPTNERDRKGASNPPHPYVLPLGSCLTVKGLRLTVKGLRLTLTGLLLTLKGLRLTLKGLL